MDSALPQSHPRFFRFLEKLKLLQRDTDGACVRADNNITIARKRRASVEARRGKLFNIVEGWRDSFSDEQKIKYLREIAHLFSLGSKQRREYREVAANVHN